MEGDAGIHGKGLEPLAHEFGVELPDLLDLERRAEHEERPARDIDGDSRQCFVHGQVDVGVARDAALVGQGLGEGLAERDAGILRGVVLIDVQVARDRDVDVEQGMAGQQFEHMVKEADARRDGSPTGSVEVHRDVDVGFRRAAVDAGGAHA